MQLMANEQCAKHIECLNQAAHITKDIICKDFGMLQACIPTMHAVISLTQQDHVNILALSRQQAQANLSYAADRGMPQLQASTHADTHACRGVACSGAAHVQLEP